MNTTHTTLKSELERADALDAQGQHGDAEVVRIFARKDFPNGDVEPPALFVNGVRDYECRDGHKWTAKPVQSEATANLSGERSQSCPVCGKLHIFASKVYEAKPVVSEYDTQAETFLTTHGLKFRATLSDSKSPAWGEDGKHGHHYRVTISRNGVHTSRNASQTRLVFDFWDSLANYQKGIQTVSPYSVLDCISSDAYTPETFAEFCAEYGYEADSIKALQQFRRCDRFAKRLRAFFTSQELEALCEIH